MKKEQILKKHQQKIIEHQKLNMAYRNNQNIRRIEKKKAFFDNPRNDKFS